MTFLDSKEQVMEVVFSKYGRYLLSIGKFNPTYYAFLDDDVIYDSRYIGVEQSQSQVEDTIFLYPRMSDFALGLNNGTNDLISTDSIETITLLQDSTLPVIGNSQIGNQYIPSWNIKSHKDAILELVSGSQNIVNKTVLQINIEEKLIDISIKSKEFSEEGYDNITKFPDGTAVAIESDYILLDFVENNVTEQNDQFEYFIVKHFEEGQLDGTKVLSKINDGDMVQGEILVNDPQFVKNGIENLLEATLNPDFIEYYFEIHSDNDVDDEAKKVLCSYYKDQLKKGFSYLDRILDCPDKESKILPLQRTDIYHSGVTKEEVREKCE